MKAPCGSFFNYRAKRKKEKKRKRRNLLSEFVNKKN
jgi:hypothetical protein